MAYSGAYSCGCGLVPYEQICQILNVKSTYDEQQSSRAIDLYNITVSVYLEDKLEDGCVLRRGHSVLLHFQ